MKLIPLFIPLILLFISCSQDQNNKTLTLAHSLPVTHPVHQGIEVFKKELHQLSKGKLNVKIYPDSQLGDEREALELLQIGSLSMTKVSASTLVNFVPEYGVLNIPYIFKNKTHKFKVLEGEIGKSLLEKGNDKWLRGLCFFDAGSRCFYTSKKPIKSAVDVTGLKIRVMNDPVAVKTVKALSGSPTPMAYGELYTALQQGVVDGAENNIPSFVSSRHFEICKYYSFDEHTSMPDVLIMGTKSLERLSAEEKEWVFKAAKISAEAQKGFWEASEKEGLAILEKEGVQLFYPEKKDFTLKTTSVLDSFTDPKIKELIEAIQNVN